MPVRTRVTFMPQSGSQIVADGILFEVCPKEGDDIAVEVPGSQPKAVHMGRVKKVVHHGRAPDALQEPFVDINAEKFGA